MPYIINKIKNKEILEKEVIMDGATVKVYNFEILRMLGLDARKAKRIANKAFIFNDNTCYNLENSNGNIYGVIDGVLITKDIVEIFAPLDIY